MKLSNVNEIYRIIKLPYEMVVLLKLGTMCDCYYSKFRICITSTESSHYVATYTLVMVHPLCQTLDPLLVLAAYTCIETHDSVLCGQV